MSEIGRRPSILWLKKKYFKDSKVIGAELGVFKGINAERLLNELNIDKLYLIDLWITPLNQTKYDYNEHYKIVQNKFANNKKIIIYKMDTAEAAKNIKDNSLDFVYVDATHTKEGCKRDMEAWYPKLKKGGVLFGHDYYCCKGVNEAVNEFAKKISRQVYEFNAIGLNDRVRYGEWVLIK